MTALSTRERMSILLSRELSDHELVLTGAASAVPLAACLLAKDRHAPSLTILGAGVYINPRRLVPGFIAGWDRRPEAIADMTDVFFATEQGIDLMFDGGMQIDQYGTANVTRTNAGARTIYGPGLANAMLGYTARRTILYTERHDTRTLVDEVDYASAVGHRHHGRSRAELGLENYGPALLLTPEILFRPDENGLLQPSAKHGSASWEEIRNRTAWPLKSEPARMAISDDEVDHLRRIDDRGLLRE